MKMVFTTGEAADVCGLSQQTVIRCFDSGRLKGFRVPGSRFRRIPRESLIAFMKDHGMPLDNLDAGKQRILIIRDGAQSSVAAGSVLQQDHRFDVREVAEGYEAGIVTHQYMPDLIVLDSSLKAPVALAICRTIQANEALRQIKLVLAGPADSTTVQSLLDAGVRDHIKDPDNLERLTDRLCRLLD